MPADPLNAQPMHQLNITPLIDVMLVLLIMFIITLPVMTHKVPIDLPTGPVVPGTPPPRMDMMITEAGAVFIDNVQVNDAALRDRLTAIAEDPDRPVLAIFADGEARYDRVDHVLADVSRSGQTSIAFTGLAEHSGQF